MSRRGLHQPHKDDGLDYNIANLFQVPLGCWNRHRAIAIVPPLFFHLRFTIHDLLSCA